MTPEEKRLLEETHEIATENNEILKRMQRASRFSLFFRVLYWVVIIGGAVGAYYLIEPYIDALKEAYSKLGIF